MKYCMIEIAFDSKEEVDETIKILLKNKLAASCQIVESISKWNWQDEYEEAKEYLVFIKTRKELSSKIYDVVKSIHSYNCFEFAIFEFDSCSKEYLDWISEETRN